jgi:hypothetical protein
MSARPPLWRGALPSGRSPSRNADRGHEPAGDRVERDPFPHESVELTSKPTLGDRQNGNGWRSEQVVQRIVPIRPLSLLQDDDIRPDAASFVEDASSGDVPANNLEVILR